ncbi:hypothetical protein [Streptomyces sp. NPDC085665]|uniref:hypothetical protein n=1 Tax=Streptomyces sp. NPDC085665 TaxID=3365735 RepID=UPI0037D863FF
MPERTDIGIDVLPSLRGVDTRPTVPEAGPANGAHRARLFALREAFDLAVTGRYMQAADRLQKTVNELNDKQLCGWLKEQKAAYLHFTDEALAQKALMGALPPRCRRPLPTAGLHRHARPGR